MPRIRTIVLIAAAALLTLGLVASPAAAIRQLHVTATIADHHPEPGSEVVPTVTAVDQHGKAIKNVRCVFSWHLQNSTLKAARYTNVAGVAGHRRRLANPVHGAIVWVTVKCSWQGQVRSCKTWYVPRRALPATPSFLFLGDSLTVGLFSSDLEHSYRYMLGQRFNATVDRIQGQSGGGSYDFLTQEADITAATPDVLILELGTNDFGHAGQTPVTLATNLRTLIGWTRAGNPNCRIVVLGLWGRTESSVWDPEVERVANDYGGHFVSLGAIADDPANRSVAGQPSPWEGIPDGSGGWLTDAFHPGDLGHAAIAAAVARMVSEML